MAWEVSLRRPFEFDKMVKEMDRVWGSFLEGKLAGAAREERKWYPSLDVTETKADVVVKAELPGIDLKDIDISLNEGILTIKGEKKQEREEKDEGYHLVERSYGSFTRSIRLPKEVQNEKINASYKNGVLKIIFPKSEEAKKKEIKIKVE
jgi:HSP20 family protein